MSMTANGPVADGDRLPLIPLLALTMAGFITILTEALPAGVLSLMALDLGTSEAMVGQSITIYAIGSLLAAIPLTTATQGWRRRPLLISAVVGFAVANTVTALTDSYAVLLAARFLAGIAAGLVWSLLAGYAMRMVGPNLQGRAIAVAMVGTPVALALGVPVGTALGSLFGWRVPFGIISLLALVLIVWIIGKVPDHAGTRSRSRMPIRAVFALPGLWQVLFMTLVFVLAHNILYTYIAPFLAAGKLGDRVDAILFAFGLASIVGIWIVGAFVDQHLRTLISASFTVFALAAIGLGMWHGNPVMIIVCTITWGLAFGGCATLFQTASAKMAGAYADVAQSMIVTVWNIAIAGGGIIGGLLLDPWGVLVLPWAVVPILVAGLVVAVVRGKGG